MRSEEIDAIPPGEVADIVAGFIQDSAVSIECKKDGDGTWRVIAQIPD